MILYYAYLRFCVDKYAIICIDDEVIILLALVQELKRTFGDRFIYEKALNAEEAFSIMEDLSRDGIKVSFVITDWLMPGMKGDEILEVVKKSSPGVKAIMITGQADDEAIDRVASNSSVIAVLQKPWSKQRLMELIESHCV